MCFLRHKEVFASFEARWRLGPWVRLLYSITTDVVAAMFERRGYQRLSARRGPVSFDETHFQPLKRFTRATKLATHLSACDP